MAELQERRGRELPRDKNKEGAENQSRNQEGWCWCCAGQTWAGPRGVSAAWGLDFTTPMGTRNKVWGSTKPGIVNETHLQATVSRVIASVKKWRRIKSRQTPQSLLRQITQELTSQPRCRAGHQAALGIGTIDSASKEQGFKCSLPASWCALETLKAGASHKKGSLAGMPLGTGQKQMQTLPGRPGPSPCCSGLPQTKVSADEFTKKKSQNEKSS